MTIAERLRAADDGERRAAMAMLRGRARVEPEELGALAECLGDARKAVQRPAAELFATLAGRGVAVEPVLRAALASPLPRQRWGAAYTLARLGPPPPEVVPVLLETLGADDGDLRWAAASIIGRVPADVLVGRLLDLVERGTPLQRKMALYCLRDQDVRTPAVEQAALAALADADAAVCLAAASALARLARDRDTAAGRLVAIVEGGDLRRRRAAAAALGTLGARLPVVLAALRRATHAGDPGLARAAARSLRLLGG
jgi:HEAT repeat protein